MLLFIAFAAILTITFGTVAMVTGSSRSQKVIERRIGAILAAGDGATANLPQIQVLLKPTHKESNFDWLLSLLDRYKSESDRKTNRGHSCGRRRSHGKPAANTGTAKADAQGKQF